MISDDSGDDDFGNDQSMVHLMYLDVDTDDSEE